MVLSRVTFLVQVNFVVTWLVCVLSCGVGCFIGVKFVGALAYADDIILLAPSPSAM